MLRLGGRKWQEHWHHGEERHASQLFLAFAQRERQQRTNVEAKNRLVPSLSQPSPVPALSELYPCEHHLVVGWIPQVLGHAILANVA